VFPRGRAAARSEMQRGDIGGVDAGEGGASGGHGRNPMDALQHDDLPSTACVETAQGTSHSIPADNAACRAVTALDDDSACLRVMKAAAPSTRACTFKMNIRAHAACEHTVGGWIGFELGHGFDPMCVDQFVLLCGAVTVLLCLVCAWAACRRRGRGRAHKVRPACVPARGPARFSAQKRRACVAPFIAGPCSGRL
jgi:hypothetical protein